MAEDRPKPLPRLTNVHNLLGGYVASISTWLGELADAKIEPHPDYSKDGVETVFNALVIARGLGERAAWIAIQSSSIRAKSEFEVAQAKALYQNAYDYVVVNTSNLRLEGKSWEDQASHFRLQLIAEEMRMRQIEGLMEQIRVLCKAIDDRVRSISNARFELSAMTEALKFAHTLGEL